MNNLPAYYSQGLMALAHWLQKHPDSMIRSSLSLAHPHCDFNIIDDQTFILFSHGLLGLHGPMPRYLLESLAANADSLRGLSAHAWFDWLSSHLVKKDLNVWLMTRQRSTYRFPMEFQGSSTLTVELLERYVYELTHIPCQIFSLNLHRQATPIENRAVLRGGLSPSNKAYCLGSHFYSRTQCIEFHFDVRSLKQLSELLEINSSITQRLHQLLEQFLPKSARLIGHCKVCVTESTLLSSQLGRRNLPVLLTHFSVLVPYQWNLRRS